jgi:hypothetical protein
MPFEKLYSEQLFPGFENSDILKENPEISLDKR